MYAFRAYLKHGTLPSEFAAYSREDKAFIIASFNIEAENNKEQSKKLKSKRL